MLVPVQPGKMQSAEEGALAASKFGAHESYPRLTSRLAIATVGVEMCDASTPVQYYYATLHYVRDALQCTSYTRSEELLATVVIISTYEMFDDSKGNWTRHLKGVFGIQSSQDVHRASGGLRQSVWWAWLQQDLWAAFREKRRRFSFWRPEKNGSELAQNELANRAVYLLSRVVNYCVDSRSETWTMEARIQSGSALEAALEKWKSCLGPAYKPLPCPRVRLQDSGFKYIWIHPPQFAMAIQVYNFAKILISLHLPGVGGFQGFLQTQRVLSEAVDTICGIAMELKDEGVKFSRPSASLGLAFVPTIRRKGRQLSPATTWAHIELARCWLGAGLSNSTKPLEMNTASMRSGNFNLRGARMFGQWKSRNSEPKYVQ